MNKMIKSIFNVIMDSKYHVHVNETVLSKQQQTLENSLFSDLLTQNLCQLFLFLEKQQVRPKQFTFQLKSGKVGGGHCLQDNTI